MFSFLLAGLARRAIRRALRPVNLDTPDKCDARRRSSHSLGDESERLRLRQEIRQTHVRNQRIQGCPGIAPSHHVVNVQGHDTVDRNKPRKRGVAYGDLGNFTVNPRAVNHQRSIRHNRGVRRHPARILYGNDPRDGFAEAVLGLQQSRAPLSAGVT